MIINIHKTYTFKSFIKSFSKENKNETNVLLQKDEFVEIL